MSRGTLGFAKIALLVFHVLCSGVASEESCSSVTAVTAHALQPGFDEASFLQVGASQDQPRATRVNDATSTGPSTRSIPIGLRSRSAAALGDQPPQYITALPWEWKDSVDENGRKCNLCGEPSAHRSDRDYEKRTDCGNQSIFEHPENADVPLINFSRPASLDQPETNAYCELNSQKVCADSIYNKDFLFQGKSIYIPESFPCGELCAYDWWYCKYNGWIKPEIVALMHDFEGMKAESERQCNTKYAKYGWNTTFTLNDFKRVYALGQARGVPTEEEALTIGAWTCAMGSAGCDMAYCAYTYCDYGDDVVRTYGECEGWDPVQGMPMPDRG